MAPNETNSSRSPTAIWLRQDFVGGLVVIAVALFAFWQAADLQIGTLGGIGPGMLPKSLAVLFGLLGALLVVDSFLEAGLPLEPWSFRGPVLVALAIVAFGLTVRPLGLVVAGPLAIVIAAFASGGNDCGGRADDCCLRRPVQVCARAPDPTRALADRLLRTHRCSI